MRKVLLIEDELPFIPQGILESLGGYEIDFAKNGSEALEAFSKCQYDIVLLDIRIPILNGFNVLEAIKRVDPDLPVIITSAFTDKKTRDRARQLGASAFFSKPLAFRDLHRKMGELIAQREKQNLGTTIKLDSKKTELLAKVRRLNLLREQAARTGINTSPEVLMEIEDLEGEIGKWHKQNT